MSAATSGELASFQQFVVEKLSSGAHDLSPEEALDLWRAEHPDRAELAESVSAIREALADMAAGDTGRPLEEFSQEFQARHQLPRN